MSSERLPLSAKLRLARVKILLEAASRLLRACEREMRGRDEVETADELDGMAATLRSVNIYVDELRK